MLDKHAKDMLIYIGDPENGPEALFLFEDFYVAYKEKTGLTDHQIMACVRHLAAMGYIRYVQNQKGRKLGFELEHKAYYWEEFKRLDLLAYFIEHWVAIIALIISGIALWVSISTGTKPPQETLQTQLGTSSQSMAAVSNPPQSIL